MRLLRIREIRQGCSFKARTCWISVWEDFEDSKVDVYLEKTILWKDKCISALTAALFIRARHRSNLNFCQQIKNKEDVVHIYSEILLSHKRNEIMPLEVTWRDIEIIIFKSMISNIIWYHPYVESWFHI